MPFDATIRTKPPTTNSHALVAETIADRAAAWDAVLRLRAGNDRRARAVARAALRSAAASLADSRATANEDERDEVVRLLRSRRRPPGLHPRRAWARAVLVLAATDADRRNDDAALRACLASLRAPVALDAGTIGGALARGAARREESLRRGLDRLVAANLGLARGAVSRHLRGRDGVLSLSRDDLDQEAVLGLLRGLRTFDPARGFALSTYVLHWIRQAITRACADQAAVVRAPVHLIETMRRISAARAALGDDAPVEALAAHAGRPVASVRLALAEYPLTVSADAPLGASEDRDSRTTRLERIEDPRPWDYAEAIAGQRDVARLLREVDALAPRDAAILRRRYLGDADEPESFQAIADEVGLSRERVRQIEANSLAVIRRRVAGLGKPGRPATRIRVVMGAAS